MTDSDQTQEKQERAVLYALGALGDEEARSFERDLAGSTALKSDVDRFRDIANELAWNARRMTPPPSLKERLMARLADEPQEGQHEPGNFTFVRTSALNWQEIGPGVSVKVLFFDPAGARLTTLMKIAPGSRYGAHVHAQVEEIYVLEGSCICAGRLLQAGDYHRAEPSSLHPDTYSEQGCLSLIMTSSKNKPITQR
jgi:anti-sigma factor ChrR (cupin superfamily)